MLTHTIVDRATSAVVQARLARTKANINHWLRPVWTPAQRLDPGSLVPGCPDHLAGRAILVDQYAEPPLTASQRKGDLLAVPTVDLVAGTATWTWAVVDLTTEEVADKVVELRAAKSADVDAVLAVKIAAGYTHTDGHTYQIDPASQATMMAVRSMIADALPGAHDGTWRDITNVNRPMSEAEVIALFQGAAAYVSSLLRAGHAHKDAINALNTISAIETYDETIGWP